MLKINLHSSVGLITNSSTEIYTDETNSVKAVKEMIEEFAKVMGFDKSFDEMFYINILMSEYNYESAFDGSFSELETLMDNIISGKVEKPKWMEEADKKHYASYDYFDRTMYIAPKEPQYKELADKIQAFLHSPTSTASYDG